MALAATTVSAATKALSITGMTSIRDVDNIPEEVQDRACPVMFPDPTQWLNAGNGAPEAETTFGTPTTRFWVVHRSYSYVFLYRESGASRSIASLYSGGSTMLDAIMTAITTLDVPGVDVEGISHSPLSDITDPTGKHFLGSFITITCRERINP